jgi:hypothetical protein
MPEPAALLARESDHDGAPERLQLTLMAEPLNEQCADCLLMVSSDGEFVEMLELGRVRRNTHGYWVFCHGETWTRFYSTPLCAAADFFYFDIYLNHPVYRGIPLD